MSEATLTYSQLIKRLDQGQIDSCYFFFGPEDILMEQAVKRLKEVALEAGTEDFNWSLFRGDSDDMNWTSFSDAITSLPLLAARRMVCLKHVGKAQSAKGAASLLLRATQNPSPDLILVLLEEEADAKKAFYKKLMEHCTSVYFPYAKAAEQQEFLRDQAKSLDKKISDEALARILAESNPGLRELFSKLETLISYVGDKPVIEVQEVEECTVFSREVEIFKLLHALGMRDAATVRLTLQQLLNSRTDSGSLIFLLHRQYWALYRMKYLQEKKVPSARWQEALNLKPQFLEKRYREYLPHFSRLELGLSLEILAGADVLRKTSAADDVQIYWSLIESLLDPKAVKTKRKSL